MCTWIMTICNSYLDFLLAEITSACKSVDLTRINRDFSRDSLLFNDLATLIGLFDAKLFHSQIHCRRL